MIAKTNRLSRKDFLICAKSTNLLFSPLFSLRYKVNNLEFGRWSVVVSKKLSKKATDRNKIKRRIYEVLAKHLLTYKIDSIIYPKPAVLNLEYEKLSIEIDSLVSKIPIVS
jgi:ribonuclease P protein component